MRVYQFRHVGTAVLLLLQFHSALLRKNEIIA
jgi:hypothetical protein